MAIVLFWSVQFLPLVVTWPKINTIACYGACDKLVSSLCIVFVSGVFKGFDDICLCMRVVFLGMCWITVNLSENIIKLYTQGKPFTSFYALQCIN